MVLTTRKPCDTEGAFEISAVFDGDTPLSSKREGAGIGADSVREIAARHGGTVRFEQKGEALMRNDRGPFDIFMPEY